MKNTTKNVTKMIVAFLACCFVLPFMSVKVAEAKKPKISGVININTATQEQLKLLHRIGPKMALRIINYRKNKKFKTPSDLMKVKGIGPKTFQRLAKHITTTKPTKFALVKAGSKK